MTSGMRKASLCTLGCLALALLGPMLAAQTGASASSLPDAPSASVPPPPQVVQMEQNRATLGQSWWLVVPREAPYRPLTSREKFHSFVHHAVSPYTLAGVVYDASWAQAWGDPSEYGSGMEGWGKRLGAAAAGTESRSFLGTFLLPTLLHQDPRYFAMYHGPVFKRGLHAVKRVLVTRNDDGQDVFNTSGMLSIAFTESLGMAWTPEGERSAGTTFTRMLGAMQGDATSYVLREFTPDFRRFFKRHAPKSLQRIEQRMPSQVTGDTSKP
jgi:hypothetical protein